MNKQAATKHQVFASYRRLVAERNPGLCKNQITEIVYRVLNAYYRAKRNA